MSSILRTHCLIHYYFLLSGLLISTDTGVAHPVNRSLGKNWKPEDNARIASHEYRQKRETYSRTFKADPPVPENVGYGVDVFDLSSTNFVGTFRVTNNSAGVPHLFSIRDGRYLCLNSSVSERERKMFDFEAFPLFEVDVSVWTSGSENEVRLTVQIPLSDVNDEPPQFVMKATPILAQVRSDAMPWTLVCELEARDEDSHPDLLMKLVKVEPKAYSSRFRFQQDSRTGSNVKGSIVIAGRGVLQSSQEITLTVTVEDRNTTGRPQVTVEKVYVLVGVRPPQFGYPEYTGYITESVGIDDKNRVTTDGNKPLVVDVINFDPSSSVAIKLLEVDGTTSTRFEISTDGQIWNLQAIDFETTRSVALTMEATNIGSNNHNFSRLHIIITDENDHAPEFTKDNYMVTIPEDTAISHFVLQVSAGDRDSGVNQDLEFYIPRYDTHFDIDTDKKGDIYVGNLTVKRTLDYDSLDVPVLIFPVHVRDKGVPSKTAIAQIIITLTNVNDNRPEITVDGSNNGTIGMIETLEPGSVLTVVQAWDRDWDGVAFSFADTTLNSDIFSIDPTTGVIKTTRPVDATRDVYEMTILVADDGACCGRETTLTSTSVLNVEVIDINSNIPEFVRCSNYDMLKTLLEDSSIGTTVITVSASDSDRGENGRVIYEIDSTNSPFAIDPRTGLITVKGAITRKPNGYEQVTVTGRNPGAVPPMIGWCSFRVQIEDINDHPPTFSSSQYDVEVLKTASVGDEIVKMLATDGDMIGNNSKITYQLRPINSSDGPIFNINGQSGIVSLGQSITSDVDHVYECIVTATDHGIHPGPLSGTTTLGIKVVDQKTSTPTWVNIPTTKEFFVDETVGPGHVITSLTCQSNYEAEPGVNFLVYNAEDSITTASKEFGTKNATNPSTVNLITLGTYLDYEKRQTYIIHVVCQDFDSNNKDTQLTLTIRLIDANDERPRFVGLVEANSGYYVGSAPENANPGAFVTYVQALDDDTDPLFKNITFSIEGKESDVFGVSPVSSNQAKILTKRRLDREAKDTYYVNVIARDSALSGYNTATRYIQVTVTDTNDNSPFFLQNVYTHAVSESAKVNDVIFYVTAQDIDTVDAELDYVFVSGNTNGVFSVLSGSGEIRVARKLDYDVMDDKVYRLILQASDQGATHTNTTTIEVTILDENDNPPVFTSDVYEVKDKAVENNFSITNDNPLPLIQVSATDKDQRQQTEIRYSLLNASISIRNLFTIHPVTGNVYLTGVLDRERLEPFYTVAVMARDETSDPLFGYAEVKVYPVDVNERPVFDREDIRVFLEENSPRDTVVTTIVAIDRDEGLNGKVTYSLEPQEMSQYFRIEEDSGKLLTSVENLDAERLSRLLVTVVAHDLGNPSLSANMTVTVVITDTNDNAPRFLQDEYSISISESIIGNLVVDRPITVVDKDVDIINRQLVYSIHGDDNSGHFFVQHSSNNLGIAFIGVHRSNPLDYENGQRNFSLTVRVTDGRPDHSDSAAISVFVGDYNDNAPVFGRSFENVTLSDGTARFTYVTQFHATDADEGINAEIMFSILRESDPRYEFYVYPDNGTVITRKVLDREKEPVIRLIVIATDKGDTPLSSSATLVITLIDTNDWAPHFKERYLPKVEENVPNNNRLILEIFASDPDTLPFGPPFGFKLPPTCNTRACQLFQLELNEDGDGGNGTAFIRTSNTFDREFQKEYHLPIVMWDARGSNDPVLTSQTATNTLTIVIGDQNDNEHFHGHQNIYVYNYRGTKGPKEIGRVYAKDLDDWDTPDKTFTAQLSPLLEMYFSVASDTGMITMFENVPPNKPQPSSTYDFDVKVYDKKFDKTVTCSVSVSVEELSDEAVRTCGSVRLAGITAEGFVLKDGQADSKYDMFQDKLSSILGYSSSSNVQIVSIQDSDDGLDVRFSAHGSPYLNPSQVESALMLHQNDFESDLEISVTMLPINPCMDEIYDVGCSVVLEVTQEANLVNTNGTSYVGVQVRSTAVPGCLDCEFPTSEHCHGGYCYNGGSCLQDDWGKISCQCHPGFDGPRCQQRRHHFDGSSLAFYPSLSVSASGRTMFDFITLKENAIVMYAGVVQNEGNYFIFELQSGYPRLRINLGAGELFLTLEGKDQSGNQLMGKLSDGKWHHVDIDKNGQHVLMTVDKCQYVAVTSQQSSNQDWAPCRVSGSVPGPDIFLNTPGFLHVGGHYSQSGLTSNGFSGCLKNLVHNTKLYDLTYKEIPSWNSGKANCPREDRTCSNGTICGQRADCVTEWLPSDRVVSCSCHPGWKGDKCVEDAPIKDFGTASFLKWKLSDQLISTNVRHHSVSLMFRTRQSTGTLFSMTNDHLDSIVIQLSGGKLVIVYSTDAGNEVETITLENVRAATGQWHSLVVERHGREFSLSLDNGEGRNFFQHVLGQEGAMVEFGSFPWVSSGARIDRVIQDRVDDDDFVDEDLVNTCIRDVRYNDVWLPMVTSNNTVDVLLDGFNNVKDGCSRQDCVADNCEPGTICYPLWEEQECRPEPGVAVCGSYVCYNGGLCVTVNDVTSCQCVYPWVGISCNVSVPAIIKGKEESALAAGVIAGIVISILIILIVLVFLVLMILLRRQKEDKDSIVNMLEDEYARENVMFYDEEGAGEKDCDGYSLSHLVPMPSPMIQCNEKPMQLDNRYMETARATARPSSGILRTIDNNLNKIQDGTNTDTLHAFADEGLGSTAGSLSSLPITSGSDSSQDYNYLDDWGPKFSRLAEMYGTDKDGRDSS